MLSRGFDDLRMSTILDVGGTAEAMHESCEMKLVARRLLLLDNRLRGRGTTTSITQQSTIGRTRPFWKQNECTGWLEYVQLCNVYDAPT